MDGGKIKIGDCWSPQNPPSGQFLHGAMALANA